MTRRLLGVLVALALVVAACGNAPETGTAPETLVYRDTEAISRLTSTPPSQWLQADLENVSLHDRELIYAVLLRSSGIYPADEITEAEAIGLGHDFCSDLDEHRGDLDAILDDEITYALALEDPQGYLEFWGAVGAYATILCPQWQETVEKAREEWEGSNDGS